MAAYRIGHKQLWVDEGVAVGLSHESLGRFLYVITHYEVNQSPFYVVFRAWHVLGNDPAIMRALSAVFSVATIPLVYIVGRRLYDARNRRDRRGRPGVQRSRAPMVATGTRRHDGDVPRHARDVSVRANRRRAVDCARVRLRGRGRGCGRDALLQRAGDRRGRGVVPRDATTADAGVPPAGCPDRRPPAAGRASSSPPRTAIRSRGSTNRVERCSAEH